MALTWEEDRSAFLNSRGRQRVHARFLACSESLERSFKLPEGILFRARRLGCGFFGCAYLLPKMPSSMAVIKVTTDPLEANVAHRISVSRPSSSGSSRGKIKDRRRPAGLVVVHAVRALGSCAALTAMKTPLWAIWREELPDAWSVLRQHGIKRRNFMIVLQALAYYLDDKSDRLSFNSFRTDFLYAPERDDLVVMLERVGGIPLLEACEWLLEHDMFTIDVIKPENIGWRSGTGLVLRDVGATEAGFDVRSKIKRAGSTPQVGKPARARRSLSGRTFGRIPVAAAAY